LRDALISLGGHGFLISPDNPRGRRRADAHNRAAQAALRDHLSRRRIAFRKAASGTGKWRESQFAVKMPRMAAQKLARRQRQLAIIEVNRLYPPRLIWLR
jgi:hypothetical protein